LYNLSAGLNPIIAMDGPQQYPAVAITLPSGRSLASVVDPVALQTRAFLDFPAGAREVVTAFVGGGERLILACRDDTKLWGFYHHFHVPLNLTLLNILLAGG
jgi:hypothetical protein